MFALIGHIASSIFWGGLLALLLLVMVQFMIKVIFSPYAHSASSVAVVSVAFCMLLWQTVPMIGAFYVKGYATTIEEVVKTALPDSRTVVSAEDMRQLNHQIDELQGTLGEGFTLNIKNTLAQWTAGEQVDKTQMIHSISKAFRSGVNWFIWKRVFWITGILVVSTVAAGLLGNQGTGRNASSRRRSGRSAAHARTSASSRMRRNKQYE